METEKKLAWSNENMLLFLLNNMKEDKFTKKLHLIETSVPNQFIKSNIKVKKIRKKKRIILLNDTDSCLNQY